MASTPSSDNQPPLVPPALTGNQPAAHPEPSRVSTSRSNLTFTAQRLIAEYTAGQFDNNVQTELVYILLSANILYSTYANTIKPIVYGNFRNIGARTITDQADITMLDNVILTVATNAVICTYAVCFSKAAKIDASSVTRFANYNPVDTVRFPVLTTALINAVGPVETTTLPYRCTFIPYIEWQAVLAIMAQAGYTPHFYELFLQAMKRGRTVAMADVDTHSTQSSHWWTLYMSNIRPTNTNNIITPGHITAYCPFSFAQRDHTVILGALVLEDTLYDLPGPIIMATVGPFAAHRKPRNRDDIPIQLRNAITVNPHVPAIFIEFERITRLNHVTAAAFGVLQADQSLLDLVDPDASLDDLHVAKDDEDTTTTQVTTKKTKNTKDKSTKTTSSSHALKDIGDRDSGIYTAYVYYFDHILLNRVPHARRSNIVTSANQLE